MPVAPPYRCPQERRGRWVQINLEYKNGVGKTNTIGVTSLCHRLIYSGMAAGAAWPLQSAL